MKPFFRGNKDLIKAINRNLLLNIIRQESEISRTRLTEMSGLSLGAVSQITTELIEHNWILETGEGDYTGGRRQTFLRLNPRAGYAIGLKLMENRVVCAVTDFNAKVIYYQEHTIAIDDNPEKATTTLAEIIQKTIQKTGLLRQQFFGVGIGLAGVINSQKGIVHYSPFLGWKNFNLAERLRQHLNVSVYVENDVNTLTLTEQLFGLGRYQSNFVVVTVGRGIGMGIVINGQLYRGGGGGAGEIGHIILDVNRARQQSPENGSLESLASDASITRQMPTPTSLQQIVHNAEQGDEVARQALALSGEHLGIGLAAVINILSPALLIISGEGVQVGDLRLQPMFEALKRYTFDGLLDNVQVIVEPTDDQAWARGAASLVMSKVFESPLVEHQAEV